MLLLNLEWLENGLPIALERVSPLKKNPNLGHRPYEDVQALLTGTLFVAFGVLMFSHAGLLTGGTAGIAFLIHYETGWNFGLVFFVINLPFYGLAWKRMGKAFTLKTFTAVGLLSAFVNVLPSLISFQALSAPLAAVLGGLLMGSGMLMLFRHQASLGGFNVLVLYLQERFGWRAGRVQMALDCVIVLCAFAVASGDQVALSVLGAVVMNQTIATNHRTGRYVTL
jgi:uncharacterized membrane-anchored protein YitT (DUF2179 family)